MSGLGTGQTVLPMPPHQHVLTVLHPFLTLPWPGTAKSPLPWCPDSCPRPLRVCRAPVSTSVRARPSSAHSSPWLPPYLGSKPMSRHGRVTSLPCPLKLPPCLCLCHRASWLPLEHPHPQPWAFLCLHLHVLHSLPLWWVPSQTSPL